MTIAVLAGLVAAAFTDPSWIAQPSCNSQSWVHPGEIARSATLHTSPDEPCPCPSIQARGEKGLAFDTAHLDGGPDYVNDHTLIFGADNRWHLFGIFHEEPFNSEQEHAFVHAISNVRDPLDWDAGSFHLSPFAGGLALTLRPDLGETHLWAPHVVRAGDRYVMVFQSGVAYRTSTDLRSWSAPEMALTLESTPAMFNSGFTESPFVFEQNGWYYLTVTSYPVAHDATFVYCSRSPFQFSEPPIARLSAHAAEWIFTDSGEVFMTHCGPGQGGVWIAPMAFSSGA